MNLITCTGDVVRGDRVTFTRATFTGSFRRPKFAGMETITGTVISDSYGASAGQHTFTLLLASGEKMMIKGRNLYHNGVTREPWQDEAAREAARDEKHERGDCARNHKAARRESATAY